MMVHTDVERRFVAKQGSEYADPTPPRFVAAEEVDDLLGMLMTWESEGGFPR
jgi:hypothetical protein